MATPFTLSAPNRRGLTATKVRKEYVRRNDSTLLAIDEFSVAVAPGEFVSIVGPSGCGKSTFLAIVDGLVTPTSGSIELDGQAIWKVASRRAMVFQEASLFPWFTVERNIGYGLECRGARKSEIAETVSPLIRMVGLAGFEGHYPHELSGGMQQRANLARALSVDPDILLMDEPFASLDAQTRELMQGELLSIWEQSRKMVLFVTHQIDEAIYLSDRIFVMSARPGRLLADIPVDLPRPRPLSVKRDPVFGALVDKVWGLLEGEARKSMSPGGSGTAH